MRLAVLLSAVLFACAAAPVRPSADAEELKELRAQIAAQSALVAQQQRRIEELEVKLAAIQARTQPPPAAQPQPQAAPARPEPRPQLRTVKLGGRRARYNPVEHAPRLPSTVELKEPDDDALARLEQAPMDPEVVREAGADVAWARAIDELNSGDHTQAETDLLAFAGAHPQHTAADNALYLAGLIREVRGECGSALQLFDAVPQRYPAGDAVPMALLEKGRCLKILGRRGEAKDTLSRLVQEHADAPESAQAQRLLQGL